MDEPLSNLDAKLRVQMRAEIASIQDRLGVTTVYVTHDQVEAMTMGDRVAVLKAGFLQQVDTPQKLYDNPDNLFVAGFIGSPAMNLAEATVRKQDGKVYLELPGNEGDEKARLRVADEAFDRYPKAAEDGRRVAIGMRPEHFVPSDQVEDPEMVWQGRRVNLVELLGAEMLVHFDTPLPPIVSEDMKAAVDDEEAFEALQEQAKKGGQSFTARFQPGNPPKVGDHIDIGFRTEYLHFFDPEKGHALR